MRIVVTGATGVIGRSAVPPLVESGHTVDGTSREPAGSRWLRACGAVPVAADVADPARVRDLVAGADAVIHLASAIPPLARLTKPAAWADNDRLRDEATARLVDASLVAGVGTFVFASVTFNYADGGDEWIDEDAPLAPPFVATRSALAGESHVARFTAAGRTGVVLRLGQLYGPGRASAELVAALSSRRMPQVGDGRSFVSSLHVDDAGTALVAALSAQAGTYNVVDDEPLRRGRLLAVQAAGVGARPPRRVPAPVARLLVGSATRLLTVSQRVSNRRFRDETGWRPRWTSAERGWSTVADGLTPAASSVG